jgi:XPG I-region
MGVRGLQSFLRSYSVSKTMQDLLSPKNQKLKIGIDISYYVYRWQADADRILGFLNQLMSNKHRILLAFDGRAEDGKVWEAQRRRAIRDEELKHADAILEKLKTNPELFTEEERKQMEAMAQEHQKKGWSFTKDRRNALKERLYEAKIPMVTAKGEADGLLATLCARGDLDIVISGDMDLFAMGARSLWTPVGDGLQFREYAHDAILEELGLGDYQFRSMCAICYTEASEVLNSFDIRQAYQAIRVFRNLTTIKAKYPEWLQVWPDDSHIFYRSVEKVEPWIREDQLPIYKAFMDCEPMPYT